MAGLAPLISPHTENLIQRKGMLKDGREFYLSILNFEGQRKITKCPPRLNIFLSKDGKPDLHRSVACVNNFRSVKQV